MRAAALARRRVFADYLNLHRRIGKRLARVRAPRALMHLAAAAGDPYSLIMRAGNAPSFLRLARRATGAVRFVRVRGMTKTMQALFVPHNRNGSALYARGGGGGGGRYRGSYVHAQLCSVVNRRAAPHVLCRETVAVMHEARRRGWLMLACEYAVPIGGGGDAGAPRMATAIDMLCYDRRRARLVAVELKTGYANGAFTRAVGRLRRPMHAYENSALNLALLQTCLGAHALADFLGVPLDATDTAVIHATRDGAVRVYHPPAPLFADARRAYDVLQMYA